MGKVDLLAFSDLIFDFCPSCEGFYFDAREIEAMNKELRKCNSPVSFPRRPEPLRGNQDGRRQRRWPTGENPRTSFVANPPKLLHVPGKLEIGSARQGDLRR